MKRLATSTLLASALLLVAGCGSGTFVVLDFPSGPAGVVAVTATVTLGGQSANARYNAKSGTFSFPTSASLEIGSGSGDLMVTATALDASQKALGTAMATVTVTRGNTVHLSLPFGEVQPTDDLGPGGTLAISPSTFDFGIASVGTMGAVKRFTVTNTGTQTTGALMALLVGMDAADYATVIPADCVSKTLNANATCTIDVQFTPKSAGIMKNAKLVVQAPSTTPGGSATALLLGRAAPKGNLVFNETMHTFPDSLVGSNSAETSFTLKNTGAQASTAVTVTLTGTDAAQFEKTADGCSTLPLAANASCDVKVRSKPNVRGANVATLSAESAASGAAPGDIAIVSLTGKGLAPAHLTIINAKPQNAPFNLGTVDIDTLGATGSAYTFMIKNDGDLPAGVLTIDTAPMNAEVTPLMPQTTCVDSTQPQPTVLNPGDTCTGSLVLAPKTYGNKNASLTVSATPGGSAQTYMTGIGHDQVKIIVSNTSLDLSTGKVTDTALPHKLDCTGPPTAGLCTTTFDRTLNGYSYTMQAVPNVGTYSLFDNWTEPGGLACAAGALSPDCVLDLGASVAPGTYNFAANYKKQLFTVTYNRLDLDRTPAPGFGGSGQLGALSSSNGYSCPFGPCATNTELVPGGASLTVTAGAVAGGGGHTLRRIGGPCVATSNTATPAQCSFSVSANVTVDVLFSAHNFAFITAGAFAADLKGGQANGMLGADAKCQAEANGVSLPGKFAAYLSNSANDAKARLGASNGWLRADFRPFARSSLDLHSSHAVLYPLVLDAAGMNHEGVDVFTSTNQDGLKNLPLGVKPCSDWNTTVAASNIVTGRGGSSSPEWLDYKNAAVCATLQAHLYCMGTDLDTTIAPLPTAGFRLAFVTSNSFTPSAAGIANADALCLAAKNTNAAIAGKTFKAFVSGDLVANGGPTAAGRFPTAGNVWARLDGVQLSGTIGALMGAPTSPLAALNLTEDGMTYLTGYNRVWTGGVYATTVPFDADNCTDFTSTGGSGEAGATYRANANFFGDTMSLQNCTNAFNIYCLETP